MEKGDWLLVVIIIFVLIIIALLIANIDRIFPTPTVQEAIKQSVNVTNPT
jgi:hypothetical protein